MGLNVSEIACERDCQARPYLLDFSFQVFLLSGWERQKIASRLFEIKSVQVHLGCPLRSLTLLPPLPFSQVQGGRLSPLPGDGFNGNREHEAFRAMPIRFHSFPKGLHPNADVFDRLLNSLMFRPLA